MSIYAQGGKLTIDRTLYGQRFKRSTGLDNTKEGRRTAKQYDAMVTSLVNLGERKTIDGLRGGVLDWPDVYTSFAQWDRAGIPDPDAMRPLVKAWKAWAPKARTRSGGKAAPVTVKDHQRALGLLDVPAGATVADLPPLVAAYRLTCEAAGIGRQFNRVRTSAQAFLRDTFGKRQSPLWAKVSDVAPRPTGDHEGHPKTPAEARDIREKLGPLFGPMWWSLCCSGMNPKEYLQDGWQVTPDALLVHGKKRKGRERRVPRVGAVVAPQRAYQRFRMALAEQGVEPLDGRRSFTLWMQMAGIPRPRRQLYLGQGRGAVIDDYEMHEVAEMFAADTAKLQAVVGTDALQLSTTSTDFPTRRTA